MNIVEIIEAKRDGLVLSSAQITDVVHEFTLGKIPDYQMSALLMAIVLKGMNDHETAALTSAMFTSGETLDLSAVPGIKFDKHSTGGVGDKVSLAFVPIVAAAGLKIAKMSGRGLGHAGGTLDKLESITGFSCSLTSKQIVEQVRTVGGCICAQTDKITPADKKIYALRDVTGTVESIPLIASSIMSKKIAGGANVVMLDVKVGRGAYMKDLAQARKLAQLMQRIGVACGMQVIAELTDMNVPLGQAVGNLIEVKEAADFLRGRPVDTRLNSLTIDLTQTALEYAGVDLKVEDLIADGSAWRKFSEIVRAQGGDVESIDRWESVQPVRIVTGDQAGWISNIDAEVIGRLSMSLGAGRTAQDDLIDPLAGVWIDSVVGCYVTPGSVLCRLYGKPSAQMDTFETIARSAFMIGDSPVGTPSTVIEKIPSLNS